MASDPQAQPSGSGTVTLPWAAESPFPPVCEGVGVCGLRAKSFDLIDDPLLIAEAD